MARREPTTFVQSLTPFDADERLDEVALRLHLRRLGSAGIGVYMASAGSGEGNTLDAEETRRVLGIGAEELKGKVPVRAMGIEPRTAKQMIEYCRMAQDAGLDAVQVFNVEMGHGNRPNDAELEEYFFSVLRAVKMPVTIATHRFSGYVIPIGLMTKLVERFDHIIGINCSQPDVAYLTRLIDAVGDRVDVHVGGPDQALTVLALGGQGFLSSEGNLAPRLCMRVIDSFKSGNLPGVNDAFGKLLRLYTTNVKFGNMRGIKAALRQLGLPGGQTRRPRLIASEEAGRELVDTFESLDLRTIEGLAEA